MGKYIKVFGTHADYESFIESDEYIRPNISYCKQESKVHYDKDLVVYYSKKYLTYEILNDNTNVQVTISSDFDTTAISYISYSTDNGNSWTTINNEDNKSSDLTHSFVVNSGDYIMWRAEAQTLNAHSSENNTGYIRGCTILCDDAYNVLGNIMSLLYGDSFYGEYSLVDRVYCFAGLFENGPIISAENLVLPATTLAEGCYVDMFRGTSLTTPPKLPTTILADQCYRSMFLDCTSLTTAPELPATILANSCYVYMFQGCTSLTTAPELPATTLTNLCYQNMFVNCTSLNYIKCLAIDISASNCTNNWVNGVAASGTFVKNESVNSWRTGNSGIPTNWTIQTANE